LSVVNIVIASH